VCDGSPEGLREVLGQPLVVRGAEQEELCEKLCNPEELGEGVRETAADVLWLGMGL
jgi:hypothetical protein